MLDSVQLTGSNPLISKKILFVVNDPAFFLSHRLPLAQAARDQGFVVQVATRPGAAAAEIEQMGFKHYPIPLSRSGRNPLKELVTLFSLWKLFRESCPDLIHLVTIKPVLYGGIAARLAGVPCVVFAISGLGFLFVDSSGFWKWLSRRVALLFYRRSLRHSKQVVIFQNPDDRELLVNAVGLDRQETRLIPGSGVDLDKFPITPETDAIPVVVMASRLLKDKGVYEFVEAARFLRRAGVEAIFQLIGGPDPENPESVSAESIDVWVNEGIIEYLGFRNDIPELFIRAHVVVLPSFYGEGLPKVLVEAAAAGRAVVTTDMSGCRDAIRAGKSGLLVPVRDARALAAAIRRLLEDSELRRRMGKEGRKLAETRFSIDKIVQAHLEIYRGLITGP